MAVTKKRATPSASRKKKAQQRIRKKIKAKVESKKPSWKDALKKNYTGGKKKAGKGGRREVAVGDDGTPLEGEDVEEIEIQDEVDEEKEKRLNKRDPLETQLFLKGMSVDVDEEEVITALRRISPNIRKVFIVKNRTTGVPTGTGFVHCGNVAAVDAVMALAQQNAREVSSSTRDDMKTKTEGMTRHQAKRLQYKLHNDAFEVREPFVLIRNTRVTIHRALSRTDSHEHTNAAEKKKNRTKVAGDDPRNLYLLQEGHIEAGTTAARDLPPQYLDALQQDYDYRKNQLKNSIMFVSKHRISIRNLPRKLEEKDVRKLISDKIRKYLNTHEEDKEEDKWGKFGPIKNVKLLKDTNGRSRGFAFVEFVNHNVALHALRQLNNNPTLYGASHRLVVTFAIEDMVAVQKLQRIRDTKKRRREDDDDMMRKEYGEDAVPPKRTDDSKKPVVVEAPVVKRIPKFIGHGEEEEALVSAPAAETTTDDAPVITKAPRNPIGPDGERKRQRGARGKGGRGTDKDGNKKEKKEKTVSEQVPTGTKKVKEAKEAAPERRTRFPGPMASRKTGVTRGHSGIGPRPTKAGKADEKKKKNKFAQKKAAKKEAM